ncbi:hypothetical protein [Bartonella massiliensis]|uniref:hypothetical protein n=1 Tax=Bartonella massiliensis TaxID=929795 RepID=UPI00163C7E36|nr:hypothetical protein [Bartonella massiliensis]
MIAFTILLGILAFLGLIIIAVLNSMVLVGVYYFFYKRVKAYYSLDQKLREELKR